MLKCGTVGGWVGGSVQTGELKLKTDRVKELGLHAAAR